MAQNILNSLSTSTQIPLDSKLYSVTLSELQTLGTSDYKAFLYYEDMKVDCVETHKEYIWREEKIINETLGLLSTSFTYPNDSIINNVDYSNRTFNFFENQTFSDEDTSSIKEVITLDLGSVDDVDLEVKTVVENEGDDPVKVQQLKNNSRNGYIVRSKTNLDSLISASTSGRYVVDSDIDLDGETITLPNGSELQKTGGVFSNGTLIGNNTVIESIDGLFESNLTREGTWIIKDALKSRSKIGTEYDSGYWTKVATINFGTKTYTDASLTLQFQSANAGLDAAQVSFVARQNPTEIEAMYVNILYLTSTEGFKFFTETGFKMVENGFGNDVEIWVRKNRKNGKLETREIAKVVSNNSTEINYVNEPVYVSTTTVGNSEVISEGIKYDSQEFIFNKDLKSVDILDVSLNTPEDYENNLLLSKDGYRLTNLIERQNGETIILATTTTDYDGVAINSGNEASIIDNKIFFKLKGNYWRRLFNRRTVDARTIGAGAGGDDTDIIMKALKYNDVFLSTGIYYVRNLRILKNQHIFSNSHNAVLRFLPSGDDATDSTTWTVVSEGSNSSIVNIRIDGANNVGNGILVKQDSDGGGYRRVLSNLKIDNYKSYRASYDGGAFGIQGDKSKDDIRNGVGGNLMQIGESSEVAAWELIATNIILTSAEGQGLTIRRMTDSTLQNFIIGNTCKRGCVNDFGIRNNKFQNFKVYRTSTLNLTDGFDDSVSKIIPLRDTNQDETDVAFNFVGENNTFNQIEIQENGSNGAVIGREIYALKDSSITNLVIDGNGGIDSSEGAIINGNYRRNGLLLYAYNKVQIQGIVNDFRAKLNTARQDKGIVTLTEQVITNISNLERGGVYRIKTVGSGGSFAAIQSNQLLAKSDTVGFEFTLSLDYEDDLSDIEASLGTGWELYLVNSYADIDMMLSNQYDQLQGNTGYDLANIGTNSIVRINNTVI